MLSKVICADQESALTENLKEDPDEVGSQRYSRYSLRNLSDTNDQVYLEYRRAGRGTVKSGYSGRSYKDQHLLFRKFRQAKQQ